MKLIFIIVFLASCSSTMVTSPMRSQYAPENYKPTGMVKYLNQGADFVIKSRREDAFKQMFDSCNGKYIVKSEGPREEGGIISQPVQGSMAFLSSEYWYILYECNQ
jgi:hypothetical protein